ncbi:ATP-binding protein [Lactobacillus kalixensis]|uniref:Transcriptional regulator n=1 Tax=Lactobacillus kalixensis DSM 16043 TaxID=1423763 RepID=A0A0R1UCW1_9LACO|nr:ATP-binding protein [Lactobacillus kalixensis]KRL88970.1 transcriptional regulator [Lactobacillus kalixensis DSM 16043]
MKFLDYEKYKKARLLPNSYTINDLDSESIAEYRKQLSAKGIVNVSNSVDNQELLESIGVFRKNRLSNSDDYLLTDGGLLFFGKYVSITDRFPRFQLDYQKYDTDTAVNWSDRVSAGDMNFPSLNIFKFYNLVLPKLVASVPDKYTQGDNLTRTSYYADVTSAAKEALVNTLMHSYYDGNVGIKIIDRPSYFEFSNPGTMRVSKESFLRGQYSSIRNPEIASLFRRIGVSETAASGGPRIYDAAVKNDLNNPEISIDYGMNTTKIRIWKVSSKEYDSKNVILSDIELFILNIAQEKRIFTVNDVVSSPENHFGKQTLIRKNINQLVDDGLLTAKKEGRKNIYTLNKDKEYLSHLKQIKHLEDKWL